MDITSRDLVNANGYHIHCRPVPAPAADWSDSVTNDLGTIELPINPAPDLTAWADGGSAQPTMSMEYEQDINIVIGELRDAIADMATS